MYEIECIIFKTLQTKHNFNNALYFWEYRAIFLINTTTTQFNNAHIFIHIE